MSSQNQNQSKNAVRAKQDAADLGSEHGRRDALPVNPDGTPTTDYHRKAVTKDAKSAAELNLAQHQRGQRAEDDRNLAAILYLVFALISATADLRRKVSRSLHAVAAAEATVPQVRRRKPLLSASQHLWVMLALGLGSAVSVAAAMLNATPDSPVMAGTYGAIVGFGVVVLSEGFVRLVKPWELDKRPTDKYVSRHRATLAVVGFVVLTMMTLPIAVGFVRDTGAKGDLARSTNKGSAIKITGLPGSTGSDAANNPSNAEPSTSSLIPSIPIGAWIALEAVLLGAAVALAWDQFDPSYDLLAEPAREVDQAQTYYQVKRAELSDLSGQLGGARLTRSDHDSAVHLENEASLTHAEVESALYRLYYTINRRTAGGDPFSGEAHAKDASTSPPAVPTSPALPGEAELPTTHDLVKAQLGEDLISLGSVKLPNEPEVDLDQQIARALAMAELELGRRPNLPAYDREVMRPGKRLRREFGIEDDGDDPDDESGSASSTAPTEPLKPAPAGGAEAEGADGGAEIIDLPLGVDEVEDYVL